MASIAEDAKAGIPVTRREFKQGVGEVRKTLKELAKRIREGGRTPSVRSMSGHIITGAGNPSSTRGRAQAILDYVRKNVVYAPDPDMTEFVASAPILLCVEGAPLCMPIGDCDDGIVAIGALMSAAGMQVRIAKLMISEEAAQEHVLIEVYDEQDEKWLGADFSELNDRNYPLGWEPPHVDKQTVDPMSPDVSRISGIGTHDAEFIAVGRATGRWRRKDELWWDGLRWVGAASDAANIPANPYTAAETALANQVAAVVATGDTYMAESPPDYVAAVNAYQAAGQAGASSVGPAIDGAGHIDITGPFTQQAWTLNKRLAALTPSDGVAAANIAQTLAKQIVALYNQAISAGKQIAAAPPGTIPTKSDNALALIGVVAVVGSAAWGISYLAKGKHRR